jgi:hypothetical protein
MGQPRREVAAEARPQHPFHGKETTLREEYRQDAAEHGRLGSARRRQSLQLLHAPRQFARERHF